LNSNFVLGIPLSRFAALRSLYCSLLILMSGQAFAADEAHVWLDKMADAVDSLNYHGTLVYMRPGQAETFNVFHRVADGRATERVVAMDGDGAEIIRTPEEIICIFPALKKIVVDKRVDVSRKQNPLRARLPDYDSSMDAYYDLTIERGMRLVGRAALIIYIKPKDEYRYQHRIWLDEQTAMPLKTQLIGSDADMPVEELFFTTVSLPVVVSAEMVQSSLDTEGYTLVRHGAHPHEHSAQAAETAWQATDMPGGFMLTASSLEYMEHSEVPRVHLVYSDGLASVSVFVDVGVAASEQAEGLTAMGAANAYSIMVDGLLVTAMGEVPAQTVHRIATAMQLQGDIK
jgi:sigma-E factor negative regulatory protein RseB